MLKNLYVYVPTDRWIGRTVARSRSRSTAQCTMRAARMKYLESVRVHVLRSECFIDCEMLWCIVLSLCARRRRRLCDSRVCHVKYTKLGHDGDDNFFFRFLLFFFVAFLFRFLSQVRGVDDQMDRKPYRLSRIMCAQCARRAVRAGRTTAMPMHDKCREHSSLTSTKNKKCIFAY